VVVVLKSNLPAHALFILRVAVALRLLRLRLKLLALQAALRIGQLLRFGYLRLISVQKHIVLAAVDGSHMRALHVVLPVVHTGEV